MTGGRQGLFWVSVLASFVLTLWLLGAVLLPFVLGMAVGYLLDPVVERMSRWGVSRAVAAGGLIFGVCGLSALALLLVTPVAVEQGMRLAANLPAYVAWLYQLTLPLVQRVTAGTDLGAAGEVAQPVVQAAERLAGSVGTLATELLGRGLALINLAMLLAVTPLVAFYLLRDWPKVIAEIDRALPRQHAETIRDQARKIDRVLAGFARGTAIVCLTLAVYYAVALSVIGLDFGLVVGLGAGVLSFIPYVGTLSGFVSGVGIATYQFWPNWPKVIVVVGVFVVGQLLNDSVLTPRLVGDRVGLHPLWVMFGLFAGGALFGFVGVVIAVPTCAVMGVLARLAIERYKASAVYRGA